MKFNRLDDNKLQIILNKDDLSKRNIAKWELLPYNPQAQKIFQDILDEAYEECGFEVDNNAQLMIEALPLTTESILLTITKVDSGFREELEKELSDLSSRILADIDDEEPELIWRRLWVIPRPTGYFIGLTKNIICICLRFRRRTACFTEH